MNRIVVFLLTVLVGASAPAQSLDLPPAFDLRDIDGHSYIGPVRDQGQCGSCYSFGALGAAESVWNRAYNLRDDQAVDLSEAFIVWSLDPLYGGIHGCDGADYGFEELTALTEHGVPLEADFPYTTTDPGDNLHWDADRRVFRDWYRIPPNDIETIKRVLSQIGAVDAGVDVDDAFGDYSGGVFENDATAVRNPAPHYSPMNHLVSLVGWNDEPEDGGMGYWILRNSWSEDWGEAGYMNIRYTSAMIAMGCAYLIVEPWSGQNSILENNGEIDATPWQSGGTLNAHGVDLWGGAAGRVVNRGRISAQADSEEGLATARGVYLWGGPEGSVVNEGDISGRASSRDSQAIAYAVCMQGGFVDNSGLLHAEAASQADQALAVGVWAANGGSGLQVHNSGEVLAQAQDGDTNAAYGIWVDSRELAAVTNSGRIVVAADDYAVGVLLTGGPARLENTGVIEASGDTTPDGGYGVYVIESSVILNSGTIRGGNRSIYTEKNTLLTLETGSNLVGSVRLGGGSDYVMLTGAGSEDEVFEGVESLAMIGVDWSLSGDSSFDGIRIAQGRLAIDGIIAGDTSVESEGILAGNGTLTGDVANGGFVAPGHSVGHLTIDGDFTQDAAGTLEIEIGDGLADRLTVAGTADLAGTLLVVPDGYATGGSYRILDANEIRGDFNSVQSVAVLDVERSEAAPGSLELDVTRNSYVSLATCFNSSLAASLDGVRPEAGGDLADLLDRLDLAFTSGQLNAELAQLTPRIHGLATAMALEDGQAGFESLRRRMDRNDQADSTDDPSQEEASFWVETPGTHSRYDSDGSYFGASKNLYGLTVGVERSVREDLTLGVAFGGAEGRYEANDSGDQGEAMSLQAHLYGLWRQPRRGGGWRLGASLGAGAAAIEADRSIAFADRRTHSEHTGTILDALFHGGYDWTRGDWRFGPTFGFSWVRLHEESFEESGSDGADLAVRSRDGDSFRGILGGRMARRVPCSGAVLEPELRAAWLHEFSPDTADLQATLAGGGQEFSIPGRDLARDSLVLGVGLNVRFSESICAALSYDHRQQSGDGATNHALHIQAAVRF